MKSGCDLVLLDLGNVLIHFDHAIVARKLSKLSRRPIFSIVSRFIRSGLGELFDEGKVPPDEFVRRVIQDLGLKISSSEFTRIWNDIFAENPGMEALLAGLKRRHPVYVISDTNVLHFNFVIEQFPMLKQVDQFILSYEVGVRKPHPKIFEEALRRAGTSAEKTFFADDRKEIVEAASRLGFHAYHFVGTEALREELRRLKLFDEGS